MAKDCIIGSVAPCGLFLGSDRAVTQSKLKLFRIFGKIFTCNFETAQVMRHRRWLQFSVKDLNLVEASEVYKTSWFFCFTKYLLRLVLLAHLWSLRGPNQIYLTKQQGSERRVHVVSCLLFWAYIMYPFTMNY